MVSMALSGFSKEDNTLWREHCNPINAQLRHPYLRAMFDFLTTNSENYNGVLVSLACNLPCFKCNS